LRAGALAAAFFAGAAFLAVPADAVFPAAEDLAAVFFFAAAVVFEVDLLLLDFPAADFFGVFFVDGVSLFFSIVISCNM
jgi:hypothetical protein